MKSKKEMKDAYKQTRFVMGVFQVVNTADGKRLIDSSMDIPAKWKRHKTELRFGTHRNKALQKDWKLLGEAAFSLEIISELEPLPEEMPPNYYQRELKTLMALTLDELKDEGVLLY